MAPRLDNLTVDGVLFDVRWSRRRRTIGISIPHEGAPRLAAPVGCRRATLEAAVRAKLPWVRRKLGERAARREASPPHRYETGEYFPYLGRDYRLEVLGGRPGGSGGASVHGDPRDDGQGRDVQLLLLVEDRGPSEDAPVPPTAATATVAPAAGEPDGLVLRGDRFELPRALAGRGRECFDAWYRAHATEVLTARVAHFASLFAVAPPVVRVKDMSSRWGSCSNKGRVSLHWGLVLLSQDLVDYVVVHELAHLREMNHGPRFWRGVEEILPDYRERRARLRASGRTVR
jgi:predicted metal-dependent hydrolase